MKKVPSYFQTSCQPGDSTKYFPQVLFCRRLFASRLLGQSTILRREGRQTWSWWGGRSRPGGEKNKSIRSHWGGVEEMSQLCCLSYLRKTMQQGENAILNAVNTSNLWYHEWIPKPDTMNVWCFSLQVIQNTRDGWEGKGGCKVGDRQSQCRTKLSC